MWHIHNCKSAELGPYLDKLELVEDFFLVVPQWEEMIISAENKLVTPQCGCAYIYVDREKQRIYLDDLVERNAAFPEHQRVSNSRLVSFTEENVTLSIYQFLTSKLIHRSTSRNKTAVGDLLEELRRLRWAKERGFLPDQP